MNHRIIVSMDNTMGVRGCDIDDMLALLMLLGCDNAQVEAVCTCYGNNVIDVVHENTQRLFASLGLGIPIYKGVAGPASEPGEAARFLAQAAAAAPGELDVVATGSLSDLKCAAQLDSAFFDNLRSITLMGGYTESLFMNGVVIDELNTSCDPQACYEVLASVCPVTVATAQNCLPAYFDEATFKREFGPETWLGRECEDWFHWMDEVYHLPGWVCWDVVAAAALVRPDLFEPASMDVALNRRWLSVGYFEQAGPGVPSAHIEIPRIKDPAAFNAEMMAYWKKALERGGA